MYVDSLVAPPRGGAPAAPTCREATRLAAEHAALRRVAALGARGIGQPALLAAVNEEIAGLAGADTATLLRCEADDAATVVAAWSAAGAAPGALGEQRPLGPALRRARDARCAVRFASEAPSRRESTAEAVAVPVTIDGRAWGLSVITVPGSQPLARDAEARIAGFAELVASAIAGAEARSEQQRLADEQRALRRVATLVARGASQADVFDAVALEAARVLGEESITLLRYERDGGSTLVASHGGRAPLDRPVPRDGMGIAAIVRSTGRPARVDGGPSAPAGDVGMPAAVAAPIVAAGRTWGLIAALSWHASLPAGVEDRLAQFAELVATAIDNAERRVELTASRARVVAAADETRRRLERDLHDGAQQRLVHTVVTLKLAQRTLGDADPRAVALVRESLDHAERATEELRALVHGILPSALIDGGLRRGVQSLVRVVDLPVDVEVDCDRLPAAVETTAYFVVAEALTNAVKHAQATRAHVCVHARDGVLHLAVGDDGTGGADPASGTGLIGLGDRVAAAGGTLAITSPPGHGTTLTVALPIAGAQGATRAR